ncbi:condensation domain-containing protein, partial [Paenibacillus odorifer]
MTLMAAYQGFLSRYTGQSDIVVGSPVANRNYRAIEGLIGFFANTLVYRSEVDTTQSFEILLSQVKQQALQAQDNQDVPFEKVVEALQPERSLSYSPVFQTLFNWQAQEQAKLLKQSGGAGRSLEQLESYGGISKFDLTLAMSEQADGGLM